MALIHTTRVSNEWINREQEIRPQVVFPANNSFGRVPIPKWPGEAVLVT